MDDEQADARRKPVKSQPESVVSGRTIEEVAAEAQAGKDLRGQDPLAAESRRGQPDAGHSQRPVVLRSGMGRTSRRRGVTLVLASERRSVRMWRSNERARGERGTCP
jgi:hypothetical protein